MSTLHALLAVFLRFRPGSGSQASVSGRPCAPCMRGRLRLTGVGIGRNDPLQGTEAGPTREAAPGKAAAAWSVHAPLRVLAMLCLAITFAACAPRGDMAVVPEAAATATATRSVFVGTNRAIETDGRFGPERSEEMRFLRYDIAVPPGHRPGELRRPSRGRTPDPTREFVATDIETFGDGGAFRGGLRAALAEQPRGKREAVVFVHGYNTRHAEGIYRFAQLAHDIEMPGVAVHFAWPSAGQPLVYAYDRDSALFARDEMETLLSEVAAAGPERIVLVAHSMGSLLTMEALRQLALTGRKDLLDRIAGVVLISPDIDIDVFRKQAGRIESLPQPFLVITSQGDRALAISSLLAGRHARLGRIRDLSEVADFDVTVVDVSAFTGGLGLGHFALATSPSLIRIAAAIDDIHDAFGRDPSASPGLLPGTIMTVRRATEVVLDPFDGTAQGSP